MGKGSHIPRLLPSYLVHAVQLVCDKKLGRSMGTRLGKGMPTSYFRKKLFTSVHYFIHLNLAISLCLGYVVFVAGVEPARANRVSDLT